MTANNILKSLPKEYSSYDQFIWQFHCYEMLLSSFDQSERVVLSVRTIDVFLIVTRLIENGTEWALF